MTTLTPVSKLISWSLSYIILFRPFSRSYSEAIEADVSLHRHLPAASSASTVLKRSREDLSTLSHIIIAVVGTNIMPCF